MLGQREGLLVYRAPRSLAKHLAYPSAARHQLQRCGPTLRPLLHKLGPSLVSMPAKSLPDQRRARIGNWRRWANSIRAPFVEYWSAKNTRFLATRSWLIQ